MEQKFGLSSNYIVTKRYLTSFFLVLFFLISACENGKSQSDKKDGNHKIYHKNGSLWMDRNFKDGKLNGSRLTYYENGVIRTKSNFKMGVMVDSLIVYHPNGKLRLQRFLDSKSRRQGKEVSYFENGQISQLEYYVDDNEDGLSTFYHENGQIKSTTVYKNGEKNGVAKSFDANGKLLKEEYYERDKLVPAKGVKKL
ncbi:MAG: toxin-antitoxin system YwqK family antitoxin [Pedobacter sp.]|nr:MAG: toxin-antitoxin system YwqK family antitoxin [Pedobacter sp.]